MYVVIVDFKIKAESTEVFMREMTANANASLTTEPGCRQFDVCVDPKDASRIFLYELYDDRAAFDLHLQAPHFLSFDQKTAAWIENKSARMFERMYP